MGATPDTLREEEYQPECIRLCTALYNDRKTVRISGFVPISEIPVTQLNRELTMQVSEARIFAIIS